MRHSSAMFETDDELAEMQVLLDASLSRSTEHLRSIIKPGERSLTAAQVSAACRGMCTLAVATVTANGETVPSTAICCTAAGISVPRAARPRRGTWVRARR